MKNLINIKALLLCGLVLGTFSCDDGFEEINTNPSATTAVTPDLQFSRTLLLTSNNRFEHWRTNFIYPHAITQLATNTWWSGDKYGLNDQWYGAYFTSMPTRDGKNVVDLINNIKDDPTEINTLSAARIWKVYLYQRFTDLHGDVPYFDAGKGFTDQVFKPGYDSQQLIYEDFFTELTEAAAAFDSDQKEVQGDFIFGGDADKWVKFANSLRLRTGMRLVKVDPARAQQEVTAAISAGVMTSNDDMPVMQHNDDNPSGNAAVVQADHFFVSKTLVDYLKSTNDPRLSIYAGQYDGSELVSTDPADLEGLPNGTNTADLSMARIRRDIFADNTTPFIHMSYAEVELLLAEAAVRGWGATDAASHYANAIRAHMESFSLYPGESTISTADIDAYLAANPFDASSTNASLEQINTQLWVSYFYHNGYEAWANWRRSGFPVLQFVDHPSNTIKEIPRRLPYPQRESVFNTENYEAAIAKFQGINDLRGRVWWDQ